MSTATVTTTSAVPLKPATITQYLASQPGLKPDKRRVVLLRAAPTWEGLVELVSAVVALDRAQVRREAARRFDVERMIDAHEELYRRIARERA